MKIGIVGNRKYDNYKRIEEALFEMIEFDDVIVSGGAEGVESIAEAFADENGMEKKIFYPDRWSFHFRNCEIVAYSDYIIAFWDGKSSGTNDTIKEARKRGRDVIVITIEETVKSFPKKTRLV